MVKTSPFNAGGMGSIPCRGAKIPHPSRPKNQNIKQKQYCNKFNKDFKNGPHQKKRQMGRKSRMTSQFFTWLIGWWCHSLLQEINKEK